MYIALVYCCAMCEMCGVQKMTHCGIAHGGWRVVVWLVYRWQLARPLCSVYLCLVSVLTWLSLDCPVWDGHRSSPNHIYRYLMLTMMGTYFNLRRLSCVLGILWGVNGAHSQVRNFWGISFKKCIRRSGNFFAKMLNLFIQDQIPANTSALAVT